MHFQNIGKSRSTKMIVVTIMVAVVAIFLIKRLLAPPFPPVRLEELSSDQLDVLIKDDLPLGSTMERSKQWMVYRGLKYEMILPLVMEASVDPPRVKEGGVFRLRFDAQLKLEKRFFSPFIT